MGLSVSAPDNKRHQRAGAAQDVQNRVSGSGRPPQLQADHPAGRRILPRREIQLLVQDWAELSARAAKSEMHEQGLFVSFPWKSSLVLRKPLKINQDNLTLHRALK